MRPRSSPREGRAERRERLRLERFARFERECETFRARNFSVRDKTLSPRRAGVLGFFCALPFAAAVLVGWAFLPYKQFLLTGNILADVLLFLVLLLAGIPAHEGLHALAFAAVQGSFRGIVFGMAEGAPYCACTRPMRRSKYLAGCLAPCVLLGLGCSAAGLGTGFLLFVLTGSFHLLIAGGDILVGVRAAFSPGILLDHPEKCGFFQFAEAEQAPKAQDAPKLR